MICSASQIDSFWKTVVLSNDWESSMRAIVSEPPRFGVSAPEPVRAARAAAVAPNAAGHAADEPAPGRAGAPRPAGRPQAPLARGRGLARAPDHLRRRAAGC